MTELYDYEKEHLAMLREGLAECAVLLKKNGAFPLGKPGRIAAFGSGVRNTVKGGTGSGEVNSRYFISIEQGLEEAGFTITTKDWLDGYDKARKAAKAPWIKAVKAQAKAAKQFAPIYGMGKVMPEPEYDLSLKTEAGAAIYVVSRISGEGNDREIVKGDLFLTDSEIRDILELDRQFDRFMLVLNTGGPVDLSPVASVGNILLLSQLGVETGAALADILLGRANPSGKLATTWTAAAELPAVGSFGDPDDTDYREGIYVGYRYFDAAEKQPMFPFGFGLSYSEFTIGGERVSADGTKITLRAEVTNQGPLAGKEVLQVYVSVPEGKLDQPPKTLAGFAKTPLLAPGESAELSVSFDLTELASYDTDRSAWILEAGEYLVLAGNSSAAARPVAALELDAEAIVRQAKRVWGSPVFADWKPEKKERSLPEGLPRLLVSAAKIGMETVRYDAEEPVDDVVKALSDEELIYANIGAFDPKGGMLSVVGDAGRKVAGAAGETTSALKKALFPTAVMADGPAGLRLSREFYRDEKGVHALNAGSIPEGVLDFLPGAAKWGMKLLFGKSKAPRGVKTEYQYCTAIPIGTALAQSWNTAFAEACGDIVGDEMERFGVDIWLAPALNIHRNVLCGRNFEYFSEDPLISGRLAAAITRGVQKHPGKAVTIKHYAANNQELNRYGNSSNVSERALREIYLRGFGICIREAGPCCVMTSYNHINGMHSTERYDLCTEILRREFGFEGIAMTDWWVGAFMNRKANHYPSVQARKVAAAGVNLMMPGSKADYANMLQGLKDGKLSRRQLEINVTRVYRMVNQLTKT